MSPYFKQLTGQNNGGIASSAFLLAWKCSWLARTCIMNMRNATCLGTQTSKVPTRVTRLFIFYSVVVVHSWSHKTKIFKLHQNQASGSNEGSTSSFWGKWLKNFFCSLFCRLREKYKNKFRRYSWSTSFVSGRLVSRSWTHGVIML